MSESEKDDWCVCVWVVSEFRFLLAPKGNQGGGASLDCWRRKGGGKGGRE